MVIGPRVNSRYGGYSVEIADVNGDGYMDLIARAEGDSTPFGRSSADTIFVIAGCDGLTVSRDLALEPAEIAIYGADGGDLFGESLAAGDVDRDGRTDIFSGALRSESVANARDHAGEAHLILGRSFEGVCTITPDPGPQRRGLRQRNGHHPRRLPDGRG